MTLFCFLLKHFTMLYNLPERLALPKAGCELIARVWDTSVPAFLYMSAQQLYVEHSKVARQLVPQGWSKRPHEPCLHDTYYRVET